MTFRLLSSLLRTNKTFHRLFSVSSTCKTVFGSPFPDLDIKQISLTKYLFPILDQHSKKTAVIDGATGKSFSYGQTKEYSIKIASALRKLGYKKGDVVAIHAANSPEYALLLLALPAAGITFTTSNFSFTAGELARSLEISGASCVFTSSLLLPTVTEAIKSNEIVSKNIKEIIILDEAEGYRPLSTLLEDDGTAFSYDLKIDCENDLVVLPSSSGTTGLPKAVMLNHRSIVSNLYQMSYMLNTTPEDTFMGVLPFFHGYGMIVIMYYAYQGGNTVVTLPKFDPGLFLHTIQDHKVTFLHLVPPMAVFLAKHPMVDSYDLSCLKKTLCGAAPLGDTITEEFMNRLDTPLFQGYGMTECGPADACDSIPQTIGTVGKIVPNTTCKIVHPETDEVVSNVGDVGEICFKGPQLMKGYLNDIEATNNAVKDGWMHTGDIGYIREDGNLVITDRVKDLIKFKAFQIAPAELENVLLKHPAIQDVAVIGIPDNIAGEVPCAYVVRKPDCHVTDQQLHTFMKENVADFKLLRGGIQFKDAIPKTPSGKILRRALREEFIKA